MQRNTEIFIGHLNTFVTVRLFASAYQNSSREDYLKAATELIEGYVSVMKRSIQAECQSMRQNKANEVTLARYRVQKTEALENVAEYAARYLASLRPEDPQATNAVEVKPESAPEAKLEKEP
jgi:hypothetical protein